MQITKGYPSNIFLYLQRYCAFALIRIKTGYSKDSFPCYLNISLIMWLPFQFLTFHVPISLSFIYELRTLLWTFCISRSCKPARPFITTILTEPHANNTIVFIIFRKYRHLDSLIQRFVSKIRFYILSIFIFSGCPTYHRPYVLIHFPAGGL